MIKTECTVAPILHLSVIRWDLMESFMGAGVGGRGGGERGAVHFCHLFTRQHLCSGSHHLVRMNVKRQPGHATALS